MAKDILPSTAFPVKPEHNVLEHYTYLREWYKSCFKSRGWYIGALARQRKFTAKLQQEVDEFANQSALDYQEKAHLLGILMKYRDVFSKMEQAGEEMKDGINEYDRGGRAYYGGGRIARLIAACRAFSDTWRSIQEIDFTENTLATTTTPPTNDTD